MSSLKQRIARLEKRRAEREGERSLVFTLDTETGEHIGPNDTRIAPGDWLEYVAELERQSVKPVVLVLLDE